MPVTIRDVVHLGTKTVVGWSVDPARADADAFRRALGGAVARLMNAGAARRTFAIVAVPAVDDVLDALATGPDELISGEPSAVAHRVVLEFDGRDLRRAEVLALARSVAGRGLPIGLRLDDRLDGTAALSSGLSFEVVRFEALSDPRQLGGRLASSVARQLMSEVPTVVVDGIEDWSTADRLRRDGIGLGQGAAFASPNPVGASVGPSVVAPTSRHPVPWHEEERMALVLASGVLDTPPEPQFDLVVEDAAVWCEAPISLLSIVDSDRQWFKAARGVDLRETPRDWALCAYTICGPDPLVLTDAAADPRFRHNRLVKGPPYIRAYLGAPLMASTGVAFGTLCVIDTVPREFADDEVEHLVLLARLVADSLEARARLAVPV